MSENNKAVTTAEPKKPALAAQGGAPRAIVPADFEQAYRLSQVLAASGMVPKAYVKDNRPNVEMICVGIMHGLEVGLTPMAALQSIAVINGTPSIWGDGMLALIQGSGLLEDIEETSEVNDKGEWQYSICTMWRKGRKTPTQRQFTRVMAAKAGLLGKSGPWSQYPDRMGQMRARSWCARDAFPDVLRGLHNTEETMDMVDITSTASATVAEPRRSDYTPSEPATRTDPEPEPEVATWPAFDFTGEQLPEQYTAAQWVANFTEAMQKADKDQKVRFALLDANEDTAHAIVKSGELTDEQCVGLLAFWASAAVEDEQQRQGATDWSMPAAIVGQENKLLWLFKALAERTKTPADVEDLYTAHEAFLGKVTGLKKADAEKRFSDRKISLGQQQAAE